jgi:hypothetical protein
LTKKILIPIEALRPAQVRYAPEMLERVSVSLKDGIYDGGDSLFVNAITNENHTFYSLIDHHHHTLKALQAGATHCWATVKNAWTKDDYAERLQEDASSFSTNLSFYCRTTKGEIKDPFLSMKDLLHKGEHDSVRTFVSLHKIKETYENGIIKKRETHEGFTPFWRKVVGKTPLIQAPPFAEFILSDILRASGFLEGSKDQAHARALLKQAKENPASISCFSSWKGFHLDWLHLIGD